LPLNPGHYGGKKQQLISFNNEKIKVWINIWEDFLYLIGSRVFEVKIEEIVVIEG